MNAKTIASMLLLALGASCHSTHAAPAAAAPAPSEQEMMQRWTAFATPGAGHAALANRVGNWNMRVRMFMTADAPPMESTGASTMQWVMDGRFIQDTTTGDAGGMPFHGSGLVGYDNMKQAYAASWIDNMSTGILTTEGRYDERTKTFHYTGMMPDAMVAQAYVLTHSTETWSDADHFVVRNYAPGPDGKEFLNMELEYTRAK